MGTQRVKKKARRRKTKPKICRFCEDAIIYIDFRNVDLLGRYLTELGRIIPRRITGTCPRHQKMLTRAVKLARNLSLVPCS